MTFTGTIADINAALEGATFVATPTFTGAASVQIITDDLGNTGTGGALGDSDTVAITVQPSDASELWITSADDEAAWNQGEAVTFGDPGASYEPGPTYASGTTSGTFDTGVFDAAAFAANSTAELRALSYVAADITIGSTVTFGLQAGDLLFTTRDSENLTSVNSISMDNQDLVAFVVNTLHLGDDVADSPGKLPGG